VAGRKVFRYTSLARRCQFTSLTPGLFTVRSVTRHPTSKDLRLAGPVIGTGVASAQTKPHVRSKRAPTVLRRSDRLPGSVVQPFGRHIAFGEDPATQMNFVWQVPVPVDNPFVRIGTDLRARQPAIRTTPSAELPPGSVGGVSRAASNLPAPLSGL
jgi:hypothetical protein